MKITEGLADTIEIPDGRRDVLIFDDTLKGFGLRVFRTGTAAYFCDYYLLGRRRRISLGPAEKGRLAKARKEAADIIAGARLGNDILADRADRKAKQQASFGRLATKFLAEAKKRLRPRTYAEWDRYLARYTKPLLHDKAITAIDRRDIVEQIDAIAEENGTVAADRCKTALSAFFAWCVEREHRETNPVTQVAKRSRNPTRSRVLDDAELAEVWQHSSTGEYGSIVRLLMLLGQRREEIGGLRWPEVETKSAWITFPPARTKNRREHRLPISSQAVAILDAIPQWEKRDLVFGEGEGPFSNWSKSKKRVTAAIDKARKDAGEKPMPGWTLHDLRRSVASGMARIGVPLPVIERVLNHVSGPSFGGVQGVYQRHTFEAEMRDALQKWADHIAGITGEHQGAQPATHQSHAA